MNLNLRQAIMLKVHDKSSEELFHVIGDSIDGDERALPGLGVLFEIMWKHIDESTKQELVNTLKAHLTQ
jgi:small acid-soluble spore protein I (minor)